MTDTNKIPPGQPNGQAELDPRAFALSALLLNYRRRLLEVEAAAFNFGDTADFMVEQFLKEYGDLFVVYPAREVDPHAEEFADLRDQFAIAALQGFLAGTSTIKQTLGEAYVAENAYSYADAMLAARKGRA